MLLVIFLMTSIAGINKAWAQLTEEDQSQISLDAETKIISLESLLNYLSDPAKKKTRNRMASNSFNPESEDRIFNGPEVRIENDIDPRNLTTPPGDPHSVSRYLKDLNVFYTPVQSQRSNSIRFSNIRILEIGQESYTYARVFFLSKYSGSYFTDPSLEYKTTSRVAEIIAQKVNNRWTTTIANISFAKEDEIEAVFGAIGNVQLVDRIEDGKTQLEGDLQRVTNIIDNILREIDRMYPKTIIKEDLDQSTYDEAMGALDLADSLSIKAISEVEKVNQSTAFAKLKATAIDSLLNLSDSEIENIYSIEDLYAQQLSYVIAANESSQNYLAEAQIASIIADTLVKEVALNPKDVDAIVANYDNASNVARSGRKAAKQAEKQKDIIQAAIDRMKKAQTDALESEKTAVSYQNRVEGVLDDALSEQQSAQKASFQASLYLENADSAIARVEELIGPAIYDTEEKNMMIRGMNTRIEDALYQLRFTAREATNIAGSLNDQSIATRQQELISRANQVVLLGQQIFDRVDEAQPAFYEAISRAKNASGVDSLPASIQEIRQQKLDVQFAFTRARRAKNRASYMAGGTQKVLDQAKVNMAESRRKRQTAIDSAVIASGVMQEARTYLESANSASATANRLADQIDRSVNQAYYKVVKTTLVTRRHHSPYLGINYRIYQSSNSNVGNSPFGKGSHNSGISNLGLSFYYRVGGFISGIRGYKDTEPVNSYSNEVFGVIESELDAKGSPYTSAEYARSGANGTAFSFGTYLSPIPHVYIMVGLSSFHGSVWEEYEGVYPEDAIKPSIPGTNVYATNYSDLHENKFLFGAAFVWPYFQAEVGYDMLYRDVFANIGFNIPLRKTYTFSKADKIPREEYDRLIYEWRNKKQPEK